MAVDQKEDGFAVLRWHADAGHGVERGRADGVHVALPRRSLAGIVKQEREEQDCGLADFAEQVGVRALPLLPALAESIDGLHRARGYAHPPYSGGRNRESPGIRWLQLGKDCGEHAGIVHAADAQRRIGLGQNAAAAPAIPRCVSAKCARNRGRRDSICCSASAEARMLWRAMNSKRPRTIPARHRGVAESGNEPAREVR